MKTINEMLKEIGYNDSPLRREVKNIFEKYLQQIQKDDTVNPYQHRNDTFNEILEKLKNETKK